MEFIHLFIYPFVCGVVCCAMFFTIYQRAYWLTLFSLVIFIMCVILALETHLNYLRLMP